MSEEKIDNEFWSYHPKYFDNVNFNELVKELELFVSDYPVKIPWTGKEFPSRRLSCVFHDKNDNKLVSDTSSGLFKYSNLNEYDWSESKYMQKFLDEITVIEGRKPDYCLLHFYRNGNDTLDYHNDKESIDEIVYSISFGATRKFRFRKLGETKGFEKEFLLNNGDMIIMKKGCQRIYKHCVPVEKKVKDLRINMTFRYLSK